MVRFLTMIPSISNSSAVVVDASLLVDAVLELGRFMERIAGIELHAPVTIDAEVIQALRRRWMIGICRMSSRMAR